MATTHYVNRLERFTFTGGNPAGRLAEAWPRMRNAAEAQGLASTWLLFQPDERQIGIVTVAASVAGTDHAGSASRSLAALEHRESLSRCLPRDLVSLKLFDRTSLNLSLWLPQSRSAGGTPSAFPTFPVHPLPQADVHASHVENGWGCRARPGAGSAGCVTCRRAPRRSLRWASS